MADIKPKSTKKPSPPDPLVDDWEVVDRGSSQIASPRSDEMSTAAIRTRGTSPQSKKPAPVALFVVVILIVLAAIGVGGYFLWTQVLQPMLAKPAATAVAPKVDTPAANPTDTKVVPADTTVKPATGKLLGVHPVIKGDTLWWISDKWYQEPRYWPLIFRINKDEVPNPDLLLPGQKLDIPALTGTKDNLAAEDKANLGQGYLEAYRVYKEKGKADAEDFKKVSDYYGKK